MLPNAVADKLLQPVSWRDAKVVDVVRRVQLTQLFLRSTLYLSTEARAFSRFQTRSVVSSAKD